MKIVIDKYGTLLLERRGQMLKQTCPFRECAFCADDCPHFRATLCDPREGEATRGGIVSLSCGRGTIIAGNMIIEGEEA